MGEKDNKQAMDLLDEDHTVAEWCQNCGYEIQMIWDTATMGYKAYCPVCGNTLMLCDECQHSEDSFCDYDSCTDTCHRNKPLCPGRRVRIWNLPEEKPDGSPYTSTETLGQITERLGQDTFLVKMDDGERIMVKEDDIV
ncbi:MAG: hypothetical protein NC489_45020 [Ruminococcus flavefaciens]|nr:hypothetical protein [Ruminococcus flavefaciens]